MKMNKAKEKYYKDLNSKMNCVIKNYVTELELQNKRMLEYIVLKIKNDWSACDDVGLSFESFRFLPEQAYPICVVEKVTGMSIEEVLKNE